VGNGWGSFEKEGADLKSTRGIHGNLLHEEGIPAAEKEKEAVGRTLTNRGKSGKKKTFCGAGVKPGIIKR